MPDSYTDRLINTPSAFDFTPSADNLFLSAMQEAFRLHYEKCELYQKICDRTGILPGHIRNYEDIFLIPHLFVSVLKKFTFKSAPDSEIELTLHSSGTTGERSAIYLDRITLNRIERIVKNIYSAYNMAGETLETNCILFSYEHEFAGDVGTAFSDKLLSGLTRVRRLVYALKWNPAEKDFFLDRDGVLNALQEFSSDNIPLRIIGFPSFLYDLLEYHRQKGLEPFNFGPESHIIIGGGWKTRADREIPKDRFKQAVGEWLGIPPENIRDLFGMVEHGVPYCECEKGNLHIPIYSRAVARDPATLKPLPHFTPGLLHFYTPYLHSYPAISLLTTDRGTTGINCPCGRNAPYITPLGRAGVKKHRSCALKALEYLPGKSDRQGES